MNARMIAALSLLSLVAFLPSREAAAIDDVVYNQDGNKHYYKRYSELVTWKTAKSRAEDVGGYLATITTPAEDEWVRDNVAGAGGWLGGTDEASEGNWTWVTGETWSYTTWNSGEPNNASNAEHFLEYGGAGGWNDEPNTDTQGANGYIVEWDTNPNDPPDAPTNLVATAVNERRVSLTWSDPGDETGYKIERSTAGSAFSEIGTAAVDVTMFTDTGVVAETDYSYRIRATNDVGDSPYSDTADVRTPPAPLDDLAVTALSNSSVEVTWSDQTDQETAIHVERSDGCPGVNFGRLGILAPDATSFVDDTVSPGTQYAYRLRAILPSGPAEYTPVVCFVTPPIDPNTVARSATSDTSVTLSWVDASDTETGFEVERSLGCPGTAYVLLDTVPANTTSYTDDMAEPETTYSYRVRAISLEGASNWTPEVCVTMPPRAPSSATAVALSGSRVRVTWPDDSDVEEGYEITRALASDGTFARVADVPAGTTEWEDGAAGQEAVYVYRVAAYDGNGFSGWTVAPDVQTHAILIVSKAIVKRAKGKKPARLVLVGEFDVGPAAGDLAGAATLDVGATTIPISGYLRKGATLRFDDDGVKLKLIPSRKGGSRVAFKLRLDGDAAAAIEADGDLTLSYVQGAFRSIGTVRLANAKYIGGKLGVPVDPPLYVQKLSGRMKAGPKDVLKIKGLFHDAAGIPDQAPDVVVNLGFFEFTAKGDQFTRKGETWVFQQKVLGKRKVVLDYAKKRVIISLTAVELGDYAKGVTPLRMAVDVGTTHFEDTPNMVVGSGSLSY